MRSNDIAKLAGVSTRTLRHYHRIGLLAEPPRECNGYRTYDVRHLIRLLRIGQLAALGMRLSDIPAVIDHPGAPETSTLDDLDRGRAQQIEMLQRQRAMIAAIRDGDGPVDMPPELAPCLTALERGRTAAATSAGREQAVLFGNVFSDKEREALAGLYRRLAEPGLAEIARQLGVRYDALGPRSDEHTISGLAEAYVAQLGDWLREFDMVVRTSARPNTEALLWEHAVGASNPQQRRMMTLIIIKLKDTG